MTLLVYVTDSEFQAHWLRTLQLSTFDNNKFVTINPITLVFHQGQLAGNTWWCRRHISCWHLVGRGQGCCLLPYNAQDGSTTENVNSVEGETCVGERMDSQELCQWSIKLPLGWVAGLPGDWRRRVLSVDTLLRVHQDIAHSHNTESLPLRWDHF